MNDTTETVKRGPGRPPGAKNKPKPQPEAAAPVLYKMKAKPNWEEIDPENFGEESPDRLKIDPSLVPEGMSLQWVTDTVRGQPFPQHRAGFEKTGWTPVHQTDFDGIYDGMFMPKGAEGEIKVEGMVLMARPEELTKRAKAMDRRRANEQVRIKEQALRGGDLPGVSFDTQHSTIPTKISRTMERIEIPKD